MKRLITIATIALAALTNAGTAAAKNTPKPEHLIIIGIDGLSSEGFEQAYMPFTKSLLERASYTTKKRSVLPSSSAINWATMFNGSCPELHGFLNWGTQTAELEQRTVTETGNFPTIFTSIRQKYPQAYMGCFYEWDGIKYLVDTTSFGAYSTPYYGEALDIDGLTRTACEFITQEYPTVAVFIYDHPDHEGHAHGWCGKEYIDVMTRMDSAVASIFYAAQSIGYNEKNTVFIITSDHGGKGKGHGGHTMSEMETPFIILGQGIKQNYCFDDISMMQFDVASTIASLYNIQQPQVWVGKPMPVKK